MKKEYIKPQIERVGIFAPNINIFSYGKTPLILVNDNKE
jgi:hypothetical protein